MGPPGVVMKSREKEVRRTLAEEVAMDMARMQAIGELAVSRKELVFEGKAISRSDLSKKFDSVWNEFEQKSKSREYADQVSAFLNTQKDNMLAGLTLDKRNLFYLNIKNEIDNPYPTGYYPEGNVTERCLNGFSISGNDIKGMEETAKKSRYYKENEFRKLYDSANLAFIDLMQQIDNVSERRKKRGMPSDFVDKAASFDRSVAAQLKFNMAFYLKYGEAERFQQAARTLLGDVKWFDSSQDERTGYTAKRQGYMSGLFENTLTGLSNQVEDEITASGMYLTHISMKKLSERDINTGYLLKNTDKYFTGALMDHDTIHEAMLANYTSAIKASERTYTLKLHVDKEGRLLPTSYPTPGVNPGLDPNTKRSGGDLYEKSKLNAAEWIERLDAESPKTQRLVPPFQRYIFRELGKNAITPYLETGDDKALKTQLNRIDNTLNPLSVAIAYAIDKAQEQYADELAKIDTVAGLTKLNGIRKEAIAELIKSEANAIVPLWEKWTPEQRDAFVSDIALAAVFASLQGFEPSKKEIINGKEYGVYAFSNPLFQAFKLPLDKKITADMVKVVGDRVIVDDKAAIALMQYKLDNLVFVPKNYYWNDVSKVAPTEGFTYTTQITLMSVFSQKDGTYSRPADGKCYYPDTIMIAPRSKYEIGGWMDLSETIVLPVKAAREGMLANIGYTLVETSKEAVEKGFKKWKDKNGDFVIVYNNNIVSFRSQDDLRAVDLMEDGKLKIQNKMPPNRDYDIRVTLQPEDTFYKTRPIGTPRVKNPVIEFTSMDIPVPRAGSFSMLFPAFAPINYAQAETNLLGQDSGKIGACASAFVTAENLMFSGDVEGGKRLAQQATRTFWNSVVSPAIAAGTISGLTPSEMAEVQKMSNGELTEAAFRALVQRSPDLFQVLRNGRKKVEANFNGAVRIYLVGLNVGEIGLIEEIRPFGVPVIPKLSLNSVLFAYMTQLREGSLNVNSAALDINKNYINQSSSAQNFNDETARQMVGFTVTAQANVGKKEVNKPVPVAKMQLLMDIEDPTLNYYASITGLGKPVMNNIIDTYKKRNLNTLQKTVDFVGDIPRGSQLSLFKLGDTTTYTLTARSARLEADRTAKWINNTISYFGGPKNAVLGISLEGKHMVRWTKQEGLAVEKDVLNGGSLRLDVPHFIFQTEALFGNKDRIAGVQAIWTRERAKPEDYQKAPYLQLDLKEDAPRVGPPSVMVAVKASLPYVSTLDIAVGDKVAQLWGKMFGGGKKEKKKPANDSGTRVYGQ